MKILFMDWNSFGNEDMIYWLRRLGHQVVLCPFQTKLNQEAEHFFLEYMVPQIKGKGYDFLYSYNYYPILSTIAMETNIRYVSWVYDNPASLCFSKTILNPCNRIFVFDRSMKAELVSLGVSNVFYLPLSCHPARLDQITSTKGTRSPESFEISFIGSTYSEPKQDFYTRLTGLPDFYQGYLDSILEIQKGVYGSFLLYQMLTPGLLTELMKAYPYQAASNSFITPEYVYANYFLARHVTAMERQEILSSLSDSFSVTLYTNESTPNLSKVANLGTCEYYTEMPAIFRNSKINLNITLKSIQTGIPLRVFDILGSHGFLISNYQSDLMEYFVPDTDLVLYEDQGDLAEKCRFYLTHPKLRAKIAEAGYQKIRSEHTIEKRIPIILESL